MVGTTSRLLSQALNAETCSSTMSWAFNASCSRLARFTPTTDCRSSMS